MNHLDKNNLLSKQQHGLRSKRSCTTNLLEALDFATKVIRQRDQLGILFIEFEKAFEKVPHKRLLFKVLARIRQDQVEEDTTTMQNDIKKVFEWTNTKKKN